MSEIKANSLVSAYLGLRSQREKLARKYDQEDSVLKEQMERLEEAMLSTWNDNGAEILRTERGTIVKTLK